MLGLQLFLIVVLCYRVSSLNNGLARTPPMGWMSWTKFYCEIDCVKYPYGCINEDLYKSQADRLAEDGYREAGYVSVHIDDCWMANERAPNGSLLANATRFPSGIPALADYVHQKGLKLGIYEDYGTKTCGGYPGSYGYIEIDAQTFAAWRVDYLKLDGCNIDVEKYPIGYPQMEVALNNTGRSWKSIASIIDYYDKNQDKLIPANKPGQWNDPDMIIVGNTEITEDQSKAQMTIWSIWSAPLIMSNDLRTVTPEFKAILLNPRVIAVDQDPLGIMGRLVAKIGLVSIYVKKMTPCDAYLKICSYAVAVLNKGTRQVTTSFKFNNIGLDYPSGYNILELWDGRKMGRFQPTDTYQAVVPPTGVHFIKATPTTFSRKMGKTPFDF
uniref:Alpha-galactosidase n=1 Tax=Acrobeloides nanus TaxID=290746 RepID=A0A914EKD6_9BILA